MTTVKIAIFIAFATGLGLSATSGTAGELYLAQGVIAGEVGTRSAILQTRLTAVPRLSADWIPGRPGVAIPGAAGVARFVLADNFEFRHPTYTRWLRAEAASDFIVKTKVTALRPGTRYFYRVAYDPNENNGAPEEKTDKHIGRAARLGPVASFKTLPAPTESVAAKIVVSSCMNYGAYRLGRSGRGGGYEGPDKALGYPALAHIAAVAPDFWVSNGDNVYYDHIKTYIAQTPEAMRTKWQEQFSMYRLVELLSRVPAYFLKDDHEYRYNDSDPTPGRDPSHELGIRIFHEQVPIVERLEADTVTYRTVRAGRHLELWLVEGRDYRSANSLPDGPGKTIWGAEQLAWLRRTLSASDATFKILISPTPIIGPDDASKHDNHTNIGGFQHEGEAFFAWLREHRISPNQFAVITGDRHWKYHSVHHTGYEEFSSGSLNREHSRLGRKPGDPESTDPKGRVTQLYTDAVAGGGFLLVEVKPGVDERTRAALTMTLHNDGGAPLYSVTKMAGQP